MSSPKRYQNGVTNVSSANTLSQYVALDPTKVVSYFNDFHTYAATDWVTTAVSIGAGTSAAAMSDTYVGGAIVITNAANESDGYQLQLSHDGGTNDSEIWRIQSGKKAWFKTKFQLNDADQTEALVGLALADTTLIASNPADGVWFSSDDETGTVDFKSSKNSAVSSVTGIGTLTDGTDATMGFYWDGIDTYSIYFNDELAGTLQGGAIPDDEYLSISIACLNGEATANAMAMDYIFAAMER